MFSSALEKFHITLDTHDKISLCLGAVLFLIGMAGRATYQEWAVGPSEIWARASLGVLGFMLVAGSFWRRPADSRLSEASIKRLGVSVVHPQPNERIGGKVSVTVKSSKPIPAGYELHVLRGYPSSGGVVPNARTANGSEPLTWVAHDFDIAGKSGERRTIEVWLVGKGGAALLENWKACHEAVRENRKLINEVDARNFVWLPPIRRLAPDMHPCCSVPVVRGE